MRWLIWLTVVMLLPGRGASGRDGAIELGQRRELMVDRFLIDRMSGGANLRAHEPRDEGQAFAFDEPWEGPFCGYVTLIRDGRFLRAYYRGKASGVADGAEEVTCVAESSDGIQWTKPKLGLVRIRGSSDNNVILAQIPQLLHNFAPVLDNNPAAAPDQRYKALGGTVRSGLVAFASSDGLRWRKLREKPVLTKQAVNAAIAAVSNMFDSENQAFWSPAERKYVMYFRVAKEKVRRIARADSDDFLNWGNIQLMEYRRTDGSPAPVEHLYTNQTHPYFRADHIYISIAARFMPGRQVLTPAEAAAIHVNPAYFRDTSDAIFQTSRGGNVYDRTFLSSYIRPGIGARNWVSRTNYPALNVVQTGPTEMSVYLNQDYAQPTAHLQRYSIRLDGFASVNAPYDGGEMLTKALTFSGNRLMLNFATSAAGGIRVEVQDADGKPIAGYSRAESVELIGNEIERAVRWKGGNDLGRLAGRPVRLRFVMRDADLYALRFAAGEGPE